MTPREVIATTFWPGNLKLDKDIGEQILKALESAGYTIVPTDATMAMRETATDALLAGGVGPVS